MDKNMFALNVYTTEADCIALQQVLGEEAATVVISPDQIDTVIRWLREAKAELLRNTQSA
jgi:hypothetical protein